MVKMIEKKYLDEFDYYGDTAAFTACAVSSPPKRSLKLAKNILDECAVSFGETVFETYGSRRDQVRCAIASMIGADSEEIAFAMNTTEGNNLLPEGLDFKPGDRVIITDMEYPGTIIPWLKKRSDGLKLNVVRAKNGCVRTEDVLAAMDDQTRVVALSWVQSHSGHKLDCETIGRECRRRGILFALDGIQGLGRNVLDVKRCCVDFLCAAGFKGLLGTLGAGFMYCRKDLLAHIRPRGYGEENLACDYDPRWVFEDKPLPLRNDGQRLEFGSLNTYGILVMGESIGLLNEIGIDRIEQEVRFLERYFRESVARAGLAVFFLGDDDEKYWSGNVAMTYASEKTERVKEAFNKAKIVATIKEGYVRLGIHFYNNTEQLDRTVKALIQALEDDLQER